MAYDNTVTVTGNITRDPELRYTNNSFAVANFGLAWNQKDKNGEESTSFFDVTCWRDLAEHVAESLTKGDRVVVHGRLDQNSWVNNEGDKRSKVQIVADDIAASLRWANINIDKAAKGTSTPIQRPVKDLPPEDPF